MTEDIFPRPVSEIPSDSFTFETVPLIKPTGFREYDARWWLGHAGSEAPPELNLLGATALGLGLGTYLHECGRGPDVIAGYDYRSYSAGIKAALCTGLMAAGCRVHDIGLAITPMAYFAQFDLDIPSVAMVTASHNENGWTGVKMGCERPLTFGPEQMARLKEIVLAGDFRYRDGGAWRYVPDIYRRYLSDVTDRPQFSRRLKVVVATGNGTAGAFAPPVLHALGCQVIPLHTELDYEFPHYNANPEDLTMLHDLAAAVTDAGADVGFAFDGDGDRCGVVDNRGRAIFSDKIGLLLARDIAAQHHDARFVVDVKSTGLFASDPELARLGAATDYWKTGHSHIKRRLAELGALAGFEKSGHFFFNPPLGRGYDDGLIAAVAVCDLLGRSPGRSLAELYDALPQSWASPTLSAACPDAVKYDVADQVRQRIERIAGAGGAIAGRPIADLVTVNGVRVVTDDGTWALVRASSNKPEVVVVVESPVSEARMRAMFAGIDAILRENPDVGAFNQTF